MQSKSRLILRVSETVNKKNNNNKTRKCSCEGMQDNQVAMHWSWSPHWYWHEQVCKEASNKSLTFMT